MEKNRYKYYSQEMLQTMKNSGQSCSSSVNISCSSSANITIKTNKYKFYSKEMLEARKNPGQSYSSSDSDGRNKPDDYYYDMARKHIIENGTVPPRPPHLKGREIGMWHKQMATLKRALKTEGYDTKKRSKLIKSLGDVELTYYQEREIRAVLDTLPNKMNQLSSSSNNSYDNIEDSEFKKKFLQNINGTLEDHINNSDKIFEQDALLDETLYKELQSKHTDPKFTAMFEKRKLLPSYKVKDEVITLINSNQVTLISGETGCGKTTQVPQFLLDHFIENMKGSTCKIICTQPRRISAISIAERVAEERAERLGNSSGYMIRLERRVPRDRGSVTFCTTGVVLRQMERDPCLSEYTHIIIDEIHERDIQSDFLISLLKQVIAKRRDLKVILMSATLNAESFSKYYNECPHLNIPGFTHPVQEYFLEEILQKTEFRFQNMAAKKGKKCKQLKKSEAEFFRIIQPHIYIQCHNLYPPSVCRELSKPQSEQLNLQLVFQLLHHICSEETDMGAVLIFLPGFSDITELIKMIEQSGWYPPHKFLIIPLHSRVPTIGQRRVFNPPPPGVRKIVVATNIAETSITIDDVVFVIDCGKIKINYYDIETNTQTLESSWVSKANAAQRKGRAGRVKPGVCYHLISRVRYEALDDYILPEILRVRLENVILTAKILQLGNIEDFFSKLMDSPNPDIVATSLHLLKRLEALDRNECLTPLGYHLAKLPMHPQIGKMILFGALFNCLEPILDIAVTLEFKDPFYIPMGKSKLADRRKKEFADYCGSDHILMSKVLREYEAADETERNRLCWYYFLNRPVLNQLAQLKKNFMENLYSLGFVASQDPRSQECNCNSNNMDLIRAVICAGLYPNIARIRTVGKKKVRNTIYLPNASKICFHPKSILNDEFIPHPMLVYHTLIKSSSMFIHDATPVDPFHVIFFGDGFEEIVERGTNFITINKTLKFRCMQSTSHTIRALRDKLNNFLEYQISHPSVVDLRKNSEESWLFRTIIELLTNDQTAECDFNFPDMGEYY